MTLALANAGRLGKFGAQLTISFPCSAWERNGRPLRGPSPGKRTASNKTRQPMGVRCPP